MISNIFYNGKISQFYDSLIYEKKFVEFLLEIQLYVENDYSLYKATEILINFYGEKYIKYNQIEWLYYLIFRNKSKKYYIENKYNDFYNKITKYIEIISKNIKLDDIEIENNLLNIDFYNEDLLYETMIKILIKCNREKYAVKELFYIILYKLYNIENEYSKYYINVDLALGNIHEMFEWISLDELKLNHVLIDILKNNNIFTIKDLKKLGIDNIIILFCNDIDEFCKILKNFYINNKNEFKEKIRFDIKNILNNNELFVMKERNIENNLVDNATLESIGNKLSITRERVRQIEKSANIKLKKYLSNEGYFVESIYFDAVDKENKYLEFNKFYEYINDKELYGLLLLLFNTKSIRIWADMEYGILYDTVSNKLNDILQIERENIPDTFSIYTIPYLNSIQKVIFKNEYKLLENQFYTKNKMNKKDIYTEAIAEIFPDGYNIGSDKDYNKLHDYIINKYGRIEKFPSKHSLQGMIDRNEFIQVDIGKYRSKKLCYKLPDDLVSKIINFLYENKPIITYEFIYENFKDELKEIGVDNSKYLKGLLDNKIPSDFITSRDNIKSIDSNDTVYNLIVKEIKKFPREFSIEELAKRVPGLQDYTYEKYLVQEQKNGLIRISTKTFIYYEKLLIENKYIKELEEFIDEIFKKYDTNLLSVKKIYVELYFLNKELLNKLKIPDKNGDFLLFSIIQYMFKIKYYFKRPYISLSKDEPTNNNQLIKDYIKELDKFNYEDIKDYIQKNNFRLINSYLLFMEEMSEEYVQINVDTMVKKDKFTISNEQLEEIEKILEMILKNKNEINTNFFKGYFMLPTLNVKWNKYLLVGIIRSFFSDKYIIEYTDNIYTKTNYIIRRSN